jgi:hypothetical protein
VFWYCFFVFLVLVVFMLIAGPPKNKIDFGAIVYAFSNTLAMTSSSTLAIRIYNLYFVFDSVYEQITIAILGTTGFVLSFFEEEPVVIYYIAIVSVTTLYYFLYYQRKHIGVLLFLDMVVATACGVIVLSKQPYANYIVIIASSIPRIFLYVYREGTKIANKKFEISERFVNRFRLACYLICWGTCWNVFTYMFRFLGVILRKNEKPIRFFHWYVLIGFLLLLVLAATAQSLGSLLAYGILITIGLVWRDWNQKKDYAFLFFEIFCFWTVCVPIWFETRFFPLLFIITSLYSVGIIVFGKGEEDAVSYWGKSQYLLHFTDVSIKYFAIVFTLVLVGGGVAFGIVYGYQYFANLIGQFISF